MARRRDAVNVLHRCAADARAAAAAGGGGKNKINFQNAALLLSRASIFRASFFQRFTIAKVESSALATDRIRFFSARAPFTHAPLDR